MSAPRPNAIVAFQFDNAPRAAEFASAAVRLGEEGHLLITDTVYLERGQGDKVAVIETTDIPTGAAAIDGGLWGGLIGLFIGLPLLGAAVGAGTRAMTAKAIDIGISDQFVKEIKYRVAPGKTVLIMLVSHVDTEAVLKELDRFPGTELVASDLTPDALDVIAEHVAATHDRV